MHFGPMIDPMNRSFGALPLKRADFRHGLERGEISTRPGDSLSLARARSRAVEVPREVIYDFVGARAIRRH